jgi:hypothetical protein
MGVNLLMLWAMAVIGIQLTKLWGILYQAHGPILLDMGKSIVVLNSITIQHITSFIPFSVIP